MLIAKRQSLAGELETVMSTKTVSVTQDLIDDFFEEIFFNRESANHDEVPSLSTQGKTYGQVIDLLLLKDRVELREFMADYENLQVVVLLTDNNGEMKLVGDEREGLYVLDEKHSGRRVADLNQCNCSIAGTTTQESRLVTVI